MRSKTKTTSLVGKDFGKRLVVSVIVMFVILSLTVFVLTKVSANGEEHAFSDIKAAAESSDTRMTSLVDDTFNSISRLAAFYISQNTDDDPLTAIGSIAGMPIGALNMKTRVYLPDGRVYTEAGLTEDVTGHVNYNMTLNTIQKQNGRYISCIKEDYIEPNAHVIEFFAPVKKGGRTIALISAVLDIDMLPSFMASSAFEGSAYVLFLDTRDGSFFLDTFHKTIENIGAYSSRKDKDGNSVIPFMEKIRSRQETYSTLKSQSTGKVLYLYAVPSGVDGWVSVVLVEEEVVFAESISDSRLLLMLAGAEVLICLLYIIWIFRAAKKQALSGSRDLLNRMAGEDGLFLIDFSENTRKTIHNHCEGAENFSDEESYSDSIEKYICNYVAESDREMMRKVTSKKYILDRLKNEKEFTVEYRDTSTSIQRFCQMRIMKYSDTSVLQSFAEKDREIVDRMIINKLEAEYFALFVVDIDAGLLQVLKKAPWHNAGEVGSIEPYALAIRDMASSFSDEAQKIFEMISDTNYLKYRFATEDKASFVYRDHLSERTKWGNVTGLVLARHENGVPSIFALCFNALDSLAEEKAELQLKLESSMKVVGGLASEYAALFYVNLDTGDYSPYYSPSKTTPIIPSFKDYSKFSDLINRFADGKLVFPDHRKILHEFYPDDEAVRKKLRQKKEISVFFKRLCDGECLWTQIKIVKCEATSEEAHSIVVGLIEKDTDMMCEPNYQAHGTKTEEIE